MNYQFPTFGLTQAKAAIEGRPEFIVAERDFGTVINYVVITEDTFPEVKSEEDAIRRELRGIIFGPDGRIVSRPFHKFFNANERPETQGLDLSNSFLMDKLDGSMVRPIPVEGGFRLATKMGITDIAMDAEVFMAGSDASGSTNYTKLIKDCIECDMTPIFEFTSPRNRIVVSYPNPNLTLLAIRHNSNGMYLDYDKVKFVAETHRVPMVRGGFGDVEFMRDLHNEDTFGVNGGIQHPNLEGWVVRFDDGHMVKVKLPWYVKIHKAREAIIQEKYVVQRIVDDTIDDVLAQLHGTPDYDKVARFRDDFTSNLVSQAALTEEVFQDYTKLYPTKRDYALSPEAHKKNVMDAIIFKRYDGRPIIETMKEMIQKRGNTQAAIDDLRWMWAGAKYEY